MGTIGAPCLMCKNGQAKGKRKANLKKILQESQQERFGKDPDIDREIENIYFGGFESGEEVYDYITELAKRHTVKGKNGKPRAMRSDATLALAVISKPDKKMYEELKQIASEKGEDVDDLEEQFLADLYDCNEHVFKKHGFEILAGALHYDEQQPHYHFTLIDADFKISKKANLSFFSDLNSLVPQMMRERGWPVNDLKVYDQERAEKDPEYKAKHIAEKKKKKTGRSSAEYKADAEKQKDQRRQAEAMKYLEAKLRAATAKEKSLDEVAEERDFYMAKAEASEQESEMLREMLRAEKRKPAKVVEKVVESPQARQTIDKQQDVITAQEEQINRLEAKLEALTGMVRARKTIEEADEDLESDFEK